MTNKTFLKLETLIFDCTRFGREHSSDPVSSLPKPQGRAVSDCMEQIKWLLRDEIASALRLVVPVTATTLEMVATHVRESVDRPKCIHSKVDLQFVYGPEKSMQHFIQVVELTSIHCAKIEYVILLQYGRKNDKLCE